MRKTTQVASKQSINTVLQTKYLTVMGTTDLEWTGKQRSPEKTWIPMLLVALTITLSFVVIHPVRGQFIGLTVWSGAYYAGWDPYYQTNVKAYSQGSNATVTVLFGASTSLSVSAAKISMDWGQNYSAVGTFPQTLNPGGSTPYRVQFPVPDPNRVTNSYAHSGKAIVEYTPVGGVPGAVTADACGFGSCFVVYSADQAADISLMRRFNQPNQANSPLLCGTNAGFTTQQANSSCLQASKELTAGFLAYQAGDFSGAKLRLQNANSLMDNAINAQSSQGPWGDLSSTVGGWGLLLLGVSTFSGLIVFTVRTLRASRVRDSRAALSSTH
jgi:hypothetical protein